MLTGEKPLIGFFPTFDSMGETIPLIKIADLYKKLGGKAIFFSHSHTGKYEYLARDIGCKVVKLGNLLGEHPEEIVKLFKQGVPYEKILIHQFKEKIIEKAVEEEIEAFKKTGVKIIVCAFNLPSTISARVLNIPLVVVKSGATSPPFYKSGYLTFPDSYENFFTRLLPEVLKKKIIKWYLLKSKKHIKEFNKVALKYNITPFKYSYEILLGDHTLICDDINFLGIKPTNDFPRKNFIGPIIAGDLIKDSDKGIDSDIKDHLKRPGKTIVLVMGSAGRHKNLLIKTVEVLKDTEYNVIAVYPRKKNIDEPQGNYDNILFKEFVPLDKILKKVDLAITHGGRGTIYTIAYSGKPAICIPIIIEHQYNIDNLVRAGSGLRLSKKYFSTKKLLEAIDTIFDNYNTYFNNAQRLAKRLTKEPGEKKAVKRIIEIIEGYQEKQEL